MSENISHYDTNSSVLSVDGIMDQIRMIQDMMRRAMRQDEHYGVIPGCQKPSLLKSGAEKLAMMFRLAPAYDIKRTDVGRGHAEFSVSCTLTHINRGEVWGQGVGSCSTMESKFRYRWDDTGNPVPQDYWNSKDKSLIGGDAYTVRKTKGVWKIYQRVEHDNPADYYNTCLKMAKKRAMVDAILTATAASDIFTQDVEDMVENGVIDVTPSGKSNVTPPPTRTVSEPEPPPMEEPPADEPYDEPPPQQEYDENTVDGLRNKIRDKAAEHFPNPPSFNLWLKTLTRNDEKGFRGLDNLEDSRSFKQLQFIYGALKRKMG
jgi:hypothetical protein